MGKRDTRILELLGSAGSMEVAALAESLGVSQVTVRKDLDELQGLGIVRREHGLARLRSPDDVRGRLARHYEEKLAIARCAARMVEDGSTIMVENGSCCALVARTVAERCRDVTIVTNSAFIAGFVRDFPATKVVLLGGELQSDSQVTVGPLVGICARAFHVGLLFIGTDGYQGGGDFANSDLMRAQAVRDMAGQADRVFVVTESEKFGRSGVVSIGLPERPVGVVTDLRIPDAAREELAALGIEVLTA